MRRYLFITLFLALALAACSGATPTPTPTPTPPYGLPPLTLPQDESPHKFQTEWWYFNAHLTDDAGTRYELHDVVFQVLQLASGRTLYVRQMGLADAATDTHSSAERIRQADQPLTDTPGDFNIVIGDTMMSGSGGKAYHLKGAAGPWTYDLSLKSTAPPLLHNKDGLVDFGDAGVTYYYSRPRLEVTGTLTSATASYNVTGLGWLDKQWGNFQPVAVYWDWASLQLDDGTDIMVTKLRDVQQKPINAYVTFRRKGGQTINIPSGDFTFEPLGDTWHSDETGTTYQTDWRLKIPSQGIDVTLKPLVVQSEFASEVLGVAYWEAGADVFDTSGKRVGQGFVELNWGRTFSPQG